MHFSDLDDTPMFRQQVLFSRYSLMIKFMNINKIMNELIDAAAMLGGKCGIITP